MGHKLKAKCSTEQLELLNKASDVERMAGEKQRDEATITMLRMNLAKEEVKVKQAVEDLERKQAASKREQALQGTMITGLKDQLRKKNDELKEVHAEVTRRITEYSRQRATQVGSQKMMDLLKSRIEKKDKELKEVHREIARRIEQSTKEKTKQNDVVEKLRARLEEREAEIETVAESMQQWKVQTAVSLAKELKDKIAQELGARRQSAATKK